MRSLRRRAGTRAQPGRWLRLFLLSTALFDELTTGFLVVGLPLLRDHFHLSYSQAGLIFTAGGISALIVEPLFLLPSDRWAKRWPVAAGSLVLVVGFLLAGVAPGFLWLLLAVALIFPAVGAAVGLSQAALVDLDPGRTGPMMARWTLLSSAGDLLAPALFGLLVAAGLGWSGISIVAAGCWLFVLAALGTQRFPRPAAVAPAEPFAAVEPQDALDRAEQEPGVLAVLISTLRDGGMLRLVAIQFGANLVDEIFLGFAALFLRDQLHAPAAAIGFLLLPGAIAGMLSLLWLERALRRTPGLRLLPGLAVLCLAGVVILLLAPALWVACIGLMLAAAGAAGWYPIAQAACYDRVPGRPGLVNTVTKLPEPLELAAPALLGLLASRAGLSSAMLVFLLAPAGVFLLSLRMRTAA